MLRIAAHLLAARFADRSRDAAAAAARRERLLRRFLATVAPRAPFYAAYRGAPLDALPIVDKARVMGDFAAFNTRGIARDAAMTIALAAERSRDFTPTIGDVTIGLSSGTSGNRGLFLVSAAERRLWAGTILARLLPTHLLARIVTPGAAPVRIAFFLRANSNLYETASGARVRFRYFDVAEPLERQIARLGAHRPDVLVAPASVLRAIADAVRAGALTVTPERVVSVAEVLDDDDAAAIAAVFGTPVHQVYQCTEGFLAYTCERAALHLNESQVHIEAERLDEVRFTPIVTDFTRSTQIFARYRMNDVLHAAPACACGRPDRTIARIEGRMDDALSLRTRDGGTRRVYADVVRRAMLFAGDAIRDYRVRHRDATLTVALDTATGAEPVARELVAAELARVWDELAIVPPALVFVPWTPDAPGVKRRRVAAA